MDNLEEKIITIVANNAFNSKYIKESLRELVINEVHERVAGELSKIRTELYDKLDSAIDSAIKDYAANLEPSSTSSLIDNACLKLQKSLLQQDWFIEPLKAKILLNCTSVIEFLKSE